MVTFLGVYFTRLCFTLNNLTSQKFDMSELKLRWPVTLTADPQPLFRALKKTKNTNIFPLFH
jgi:hypothetical protein